MSEKDPKNEEHWQLLVLIMKKVCQDRGISQEKLAELTGMKQSNISRLFSLKYCPNLRTYLEIVKALNFNIYFEPRDSEDDITRSFEKAMEELGRRPDSLPKN